MNNRSIKITSLLLTCLAFQLACVRSVSTLPANSSSQGAASTTPDLTQRTSPANPTFTPPPTASSVTPTTLPASSEPSLVKEYPVTTIPLSGPLASPETRITGMAWYSNTLVLLPQNPDHYGDAQAGTIFTLSKAEILSYLDGGSASPLVPRPLPFFDPGIKRVVPGFEGYEAIAFDGDSVYLTIEAHPEGMLAFLVKGTIAPDLSAIHLDLSHLTPLKTQTNLPNAGYESLLVFGTRIVTLYDINGVSFNPQPAAPTFGKDILPIDELSFPNIEYRLTDATPPDLFGSFWAINTFNPGDITLKPTTDPLAEKYGKGASHARFGTVERLVQFQFSEAGVVLAETPPIQLVLIDDSHAREWEAIARLEGRGFLLATDQYPATSLGFVDYSQ